MFREMRRKNQLLSEEETRAVLVRNSNGVLAVHGNGGYPYAVPLNYVFWDGKIYFHCAKSGHKLDAMLADAKVSFAVVDEDTVVAEEYTSHFRSAIAFGRARVVEGGEEWCAAFDALVEKYCGERPKAERDAEVRGCARAHIVAIDIDHVTGKQAKEFAQMAAQTGGASLDGSRG